MLDYFIQLEEEQSLAKASKALFTDMYWTLENERNYSGLSLPTLSTFNDPLVIQLAGKLVETSVALERMSL